uniref:Uncharacterized protein n=1 Tax=Acrobeloides nanus TaxID=290746 RepID=A0A914CCK8_9BILA
MTDRQAIRRKNQGRLLIMLGLSGVLVLFVLIIIYVVAFSSTEEENEGFDPETHTNVYNTTQASIKSR